MIELIQAMKLRLLHTVPTMALVVSGFVAPTPAHADSDERCTLVREVSGNDEFSDRVRAQLRRVGLIANGPLCENTARVTLSRVGGAVQVEVALARGAGVVRRRCTSAQAAAALIESQLSPGLTSDLLRAPLGLAAFPRTRAAAVSLPPSASLSPSVNKRLVRPTREPSIAAFASVMTGDDSSTWTGYDVALSTQIGPVAISMAGMIQQSDRIETSIYPTRVKRDRKELRVGAGVDTRIGPVTVSPRLEVGAAWLDSRRVDAVPFEGPVYDVFCDSDPASAVECTPGAPVFYGDGFEDSRTEVVTTLRATASLPIAGRLALTLGITLDALPFASSNPMTAEWVQMQSVFDPTLEPELFAVPAYTRVRAGVSLGLRLGL